MRGCRWGIRREVAVVAAAAALSLLALGGGMRETDQASLLDGALRLARGEASILGAYSYNYDKQFVSYWLLAAALKGASLAGLEFDFRNTVRLGNVAAWAVFWAGMLFLAARRGTGRAPGALLMAGALLSPVVLLNSAVLSTNAISAGLLAVLAGQMGGGKTAGRPGFASMLASAALAFAAVGARADAVLCLPFLCWVSARRPDVQQLVTARRHLAMAGGAVAALGTGWLIATGPKVYAHPPILMPGVIAALLVCGFGGGFAMFLAMGTVLAARVRGAVSAKKKMFFLVGLGFAILPLVFYGFQLYTPRHFMASAWLVVFFATSMRGAALMRLRGRAGTRFRAALWLLFLVTAAAPLAAGVSLPAIRRPAIVCAGATRFPTADGHYPMGAVLDFMSAQRRAGTEPIDHNQRLWAAIESVEFESVDGVVPLYGTSVRPYFELAATLRGMRARSYPVEEFFRFPFLYGDERVLRRSARTAWENEKRIGAAIETLRAWRKTVVSDPAMAQAILRVEADGGASDPEVERRLALAEVFEGNEFEVLREAMPERRRMGPEARGRMTVFFSEELFEMALVGRDGRARAARAEEMSFAMPSGEGRTLHLVVVKPDETLELGETVMERQAAPVFEARAVLPGYMGVGKL